MLFRLLYNEGSISIEIKFMLIKPKKQQLQFEIPKNRLDIDRASVLNYIRKISRLSQNKIAPFFRQIASFIAYLIDPCTYTYAYLKKKREKIAKLIKYQLLDHFIFPKKKYSFFFNTAFDHQIFSLSYLNLEI